MKVSISREVAQRYPNVLIGYVIAKITVRPLDLFVTDRMKKLAAFLKDRGITQDTYRAHPLIAAWYPVFAACNASEQYHSSVEALVSRVVRNEKLWNVSNVVNLYNSRSVLSLVPMGGYDLAKINGDIELRYGRAHDSFSPLGSMEVPVVTSTDVVYADDSQVICWLWNYRDSRKTAISLKTEEAIFFMDVVDGMSHAELQQQLQLFVEDLHHIGAHVLQQGILDSKTSSVLIDTELLAIKAKTYSKESTLLSSHSEEYQIRLQKVESMRASDIEPWPAVRRISDTCQAFAVAFSENVDKSRYFTLAGRVMTIRDHGKTCFATIQDSTGKAQIYIKEEMIGQRFEQFKSFIDSGDIVLFEGVPFRTQKGEVTLRVTEYQLLSKALRPLPEKFHGISDIEIKYRQRYLDLIMHPEVRERFLARTRMVKALRTVLDDAGYIEVETPMLHPIAGGAAARPFITHHNALGDDFYLRIAPELYLKRLVIGGIERVYELNRNFRNEGISPRHNPEFSMIEIYTAYQDLEYAMDLVEHLIRHAAQKAVNSTTITFGEAVLHFEQPFRRITMYDSVIEYGGFDPMELSVEAIGLLCKKHKLDVASRASYGHALAALFEHVVEPRLVQPTFIHSFPIELSPLAKRDPMNPSFAPRFELFIAGMELSNAYHELNDPLEQAERFKEQLDLHAAGDEEAHQYDADYIRALEYALPPTVGIGIGIDRLAMLLTNASSIKEVILFPTLKRTVQ